MRQSIQMNEIPYSPQVSDFRRSRPVSAGHRVVETDYLCPKCNSVVAKSEALEGPSTGFAAQCKNCSTWCAFPE